MALDDSHSSALASANNYTYAFRPERLPKDFPLAELHSLLHAGRNFLYPHHRSILLERVEPRPRTFARRVGNLLI